MAGELILIVENEELIAMELDRTVSSWGYGTVTVRSGEDALAVCGKTPPDLALMDIRLKGALDGIETASMLRERHGTAVIFVTAYSDSEIIERAKHAIPFGFLIKPVQDRELRASIETALYVHSVEMSRNRAEEELRAARDELERRIVERTRELWQANEALRESEKRYRVLFEDSKIGIGIAAFDGTILTANPAVTEMFGYTLEELQSINVLNLYVNQTDRDRMMTILRENGYVRDFETTIRHKSGSLIYMNYNINKIIWNNQEVLHTVMEDITERKQALDALIQAHDELEKRVTERTAELASANRLLEAEIAVRKQAEESIQASEERYRTVAEFTYDWEFWLGPDGMLRYVSPSCERITGYTSAEFIANPGLMLSTVHPDDFDLMRKHLECIADETLSSEGIDYRITRKDGTVRWIGHQCQKIYSDSGRYLGRRGSNRDITDRKRAEEEILRLNRHIITLQEQERQRVAKDLHDGVSQMMNAAKLNFAGYLQDPDTNRKLYDTGMDFLNLASRELREVYSNLYPAVLEDLGLAAAVRLYTKNFLATRGIDAEVTIDEELHLSLDVQMDLYRVIQESCSNIARHSGATRARVRLKEHDGMFILEVFDNGSGFDPGAPKSSEGGFGIISMKQRVKHLNGTYMLESGSSGTTIIVTIPGEGNHG